MHIKRTLTFIEEIAEESGQRVDPPLRKVAVAAIIDNPFAGRFERDLKPLTDASAEVGRTICTLAISMLAPHKAQSYGKAAIIGVDGEKEHGVSMLTTVFGNVMREAAGAVPTIFRMRFGAGHRSRGHVLWRVPRVEFANVGTPMVVAPRCRARFGPGFAGDLVYYEQLMFEFGSAAWRREIIAAAR